MAGNMSLLNPFVFNQFGAYGAYAQVSLVTALRALLYTLFSPASTSSYKLLYTALRHNRRIDQRYENDSDLFCSILYRNVYKNIIMYENIIY